MLAFLFGVPSESACDSEYFLLDVISISEGQMLDFFVFFDLSLSCLEDFLITCYGLIAPLDIDVILVIILIL